MDKPDLEDLKQFIKEHSFPTDILVETINKCNLNCIMCPQDKMNRPKGLMSIDLWKKIIDEVAEKSPNTKIWPALMGEPLLDKHIFERLEYATSKGVYVAMNSNLMAFKKEMIDDFFKANINEIIIGMDGITPSTFEKIRPNSNYSTFMNNLNYLLDEKEKRNLSTPKITLQYIVMDENEKEEDDFIEYWKNSGKKVILKIKPRTGWGNAVNTWTGMQNIEKKDQNLPCTWLLRQMTIFWDGIVPQCDGDWNGKTNCGDINEQSLESVWNGALKKLRDRHLKYDFNFKPCDTCDDWQAGRSTSINCE